MNLTTLLLVALSNDGCWLGGRIETVQVQWAVERPIAGATFSWRLMCGEASLTSGRFALAAERRPAAFRVVVPRVRTHTAMRLVYRAEQEGKTKPIAEGSVAVDVYPDDLLAGVAKRLTSKYLFVWEQPDALAKHLFVWDRPEALPALLKQAKIEATLIHGVEGLSFASPNILIVGSDRLGTDSADQQKLLDLAGAGAGVLVFNQTRPSTLAGYRLVRRAPPAKLDWQRDHPLTAPLRWFDRSHHAGDVWAIRLPADEPALEIAAWPREVAGKEPAPIDALVVSKNVGKGRIVLCQIPLGAWQSDPRSQLFLADALDYLASPVVPTPPPSRRPRPFEPVPVPSVPDLVLP